MKCPVCDSSNVKVTNCREKDNKFYRRRKCLSCGENFTTYEVDSGMLMDIFEEHFDLETARKIADLIEKEFPTRRYEKLGGS